MMDIKPEFTMQEKPEQKGYMRFWQQVLYRLQSAWIWCHVVC